jgi:hypothetical protein
MAALVVVLMVPVFMGVLVGVGPGLMAVLLPVMAVGTTFVAMLVLMLVLAMATHRVFSSYFLHLINIISTLPLAVNGSTAPTPIETPSQKTAEL